MSSQATRKDGLKAPPAALTSKAEAGERRAAQAVGSSRPDAIPAPPPRLTQNTPPPPDQTRRPAPTPAPAGPRSDWIGLWAGLFSLIWIAAVLAFAWGYLGSAEFMETQDGRPPLHVIAAVAAAILFPLAFVWAAVALVRRAGALERAAHALRAGGAGLGGDAMSAELGQLKSDIAALRRNLEGRGPAGAPAREATRNAAATLERERARLDALVNDFGKESERVADALARRIETVHELFGDGAEQMLEAANILDGQGKALVSNAERAVARAREMTPQMAAGLAASAAGVAPNLGPPPTLTLASGGAGGSGEAPPASARSTSDRLDQLERLKRDLTERFQKLDAGDDDAPPPPKRAEQGGE